MSTGAAWRTRIMFYRSAANIRALPAGLYVGLAACDIFAVEHGTASGVFSLLGQATIAYWIARFRMRIPRRSVSWVERHKPLPDYLQHDKIKADVKIVHGTRASARVRGRLTSPAVLVSTRTALAWEENPRTRDVQWAHECAHIGMGDAFVYYLLSSAVGLALFNQLIGNWRSISNEFVLTVMAFIALLSIRAYCRTRELAADSISAVILDDAPKEELANSVILDANSIPFARTHPSVEARLAVLENPIAMLRGASFFYFASGFVAVSVAIALERVLREWDKGESSVIASLAITSIIIGLSTSRHSAIASMVFPARRWILLFFMLLTGELSSLVMHNPSVVRNHQFLVVVAWSILGSTVASLIGRVVAFAGAFIAAVVGDSPNFLILVMPRLRIVTGLLAAAAWIVPWVV